MKIKAVLFLGFTLLNFSAPAQAYESFDPNKYPEIRALYYKELYPKIEHLTPLWDQAKKLQPTVDLELGKMITVADCRLWEQKMAEASPFVRLSLSGYSWSFCSPTTSNNAPLLYLKKVKRKTSQGITGVEVLQKLETIYSNQKIQELWVDQNHTFAEISEATVLADLKTISRWSVVAYDEQRNLLKHSWVQSVRSGTSKFGPALQGTLEVAGVLPANGECPYMAKNVTLTNQNGKIVAQDYHLSKLASESEWKSFANFFPLNETGAYLVSKKNFYDGSWYDIWNWPSRHFSGTLDPKVSDPLYPQELIIRRRGEKLACVSGSDRSRFALMREKEFGKHWYSSKYYSGTDLPNEIFSRIDCDALGYY